MDQLIVLGEAHLRPLVVLQVFALSWSMAADIYRDTTVPMKSRLPTSTPQCRRIS